MLKVSELVNATDGILLNGDLEKEIKSYKIDSREIRSGDFFIPIVGENVDGHKFILNAVKCNCVGFFISNMDTIDIDEININYSVEFAALSGSFIGGTGDFVNLFEPNATALEKEGYGEVVASVGQMSGEVPYTAFYARKSYIEENSDVIDAFTKAIAKAITYTMNNDAGDVAKDIINQFPDTSIEDLTQMIERYKEYDCWLESPFVSEEIFTNLEDFLIDFELLNDYVPYSDLVNNFYNE